VSAETNGRILAHPPEELLEGKLKRLGEGIGKVVYASENWVVKRERQPFEIVTLIVLWRMLRRMDRYIPGGFGRKLAAKPSRPLRLLRVTVQATLVIVPKALWFKSHIRQVWAQYHVRNVRGERLARERLAGTGLVPETISFPPARVKIGGWPGWLTVSEATERVEATLHDKLTALANEGRFEEIEHWLDRFLEVRQSGWSLGLFSTDAHLKNFGIIGDRVVLIDAGGLTDRWSEIGSKLDIEEVVSEPHIQLGLGRCLGRHPDIARRFNDKWKATVNRDTVRELWPT
jgi:hypothetical protein